MSESMYKSCNRCILDETFPDISFDNEGICNYCRQYERMEKKYQLNAENEKKFEICIENIKKEGKNKEYDCLLGVSGGRDSTYILYKLIEMGLRPLAFHCDVNMDSKIAAENIKRACKKLDVDLHTFVVDWDEFRDLQRSFFYSGVPTIDLPQDSAIFTLVNRVAYEHDINYLFRGFSFRTEGPIPLSWSWYSDDKKFIIDIQKKFGNKNLDKYPLRSISDLMHIKKLGMKAIYPLSFIDYHHQEVEKVLKTELGWQYYGGHHFESILTRWSFAYYLPQKFRIDKRITDCSVLIRSGQLSRDEGYDMMEKPFYSNDQEKEDRRYICNKLGFSDEEMNNLILSLGKSNLEYNHSSQLFHRVINHMFGPEIIPF